MFIADFHIHSKYSIATSKDCVPEWLDYWARCKGLGVVGTGDFTHPAWRKELEEKLEPAEDGLYVLKKEWRQDSLAAGAAPDPRFIISGEISSIYKKNGKVRKVHNLILLPGLQAAEAIARRLEAIGNLRSDGRPILGLDSRDLLEIVLDLCPEAIFIPAHIWTPHFSVYGAYSGFDDITECFEELSEAIFALETGLSSDPPMNWRLSALDRYTLVSNSDAHSPAKLAREANIFNTRLSYRHIREALKNRAGDEFYGTIEFFPEEGKYHCDGHRACGVCLKPKETIAAGGICPVCGRRITVGVLHRVEALADREEVFVPPGARPFESLVPLQEVIASALGCTVASKKVKQLYAALLRELGPELYILREAPLDAIEAAAGPYLAEAIRRLRQGRVKIEPGFDGQYGKITILEKSEMEQLAGQMCLFRELIKKEQPALPEMKAAGEQAAAMAAAAPAGVDTGAKGSAAADPGNVSPGASYACAPYGLNAEQWAAASAAERTVAVMAGPGTGKTRTLVARIAYLVEEGGVDPAQITAVTFTNKAATEMRHRLEQHFGGTEAASAMQIGTFHSLCLKLISAWSSQSGVNVIGEEEAEAIVAAILQERKIKLKPRDVLNRISLLKNGAVPAEKRGDLHIPLEIFDSYRARLELLQVMDYDDLILQVLQRPEQIDGKAFTHLLVDEFQDINAAQYRLILAWGKQSESIFIIGDPDQSIYGFRGADYRYFERFKEDFPGTRQIRLVHNYRSTPEIIAAAGALMAGGAGRPEAPSLLANRERGPGVRLVETSDPAAEARFIAAEIDRLVGGIDMIAAHRSPAPKGKETAAGEARSFSDFAVLYRTNYQAAALEQCFKKEGIPYVVAGRDDFLADPAVRAALAFCRLLLNPGDAASLLLCLQAESMAAAGLDGKAWAEYNAGEKSATALADLLERSGQRSPAAAEGLCRLAGLLRKYEPLAREEKPARLLEAWLADSGMDESGPLELLLHTAPMYDDLASFIHNLTLGREGDVVRSSGKVYTADAVSLLTMHAAKGLEFPVVFICGVNDGLVPLKGGSRREADLEEERRLLYVGMTRARDQLILLSSATPSPFLASLTAELLQREKAPKQRPAPRYRQPSLFGDSR